MRLATCVALELMIGAATVSGVGLGVRALVSGDRAGAPVALASVVADEAPAAAAAAATAAAAAAAAATGPASVAAADPAPVPTAAPTPRAWTAFPDDDDALLAPLRDAAIVGVRPNHGGTSLSLRLDLAGGHRAAFKPQQIHWQSSPRREIAAYLVDRLLGLGRVAPAFGRTFTVAELTTAAPTFARGLVARRIAEEAEPRAGSLVGTVMWWIPELGPARVDGHTIDSTEGVMAWKRYLRVGARVPAAQQQLVATISSMTLFDFVIDNIDRWTGGNAKVVPATGELVFMDNTMSLGTDGDGHARSRNYLRRAQTFSRRVVGRLRELGEAEVRAALANGRGPYAELLTEEELVALLARRVAALAYVDELIARHGEEAVLCWP